MMHLARHVFREKRVFEQLAPKRPFFQPGMSSASENIPRPDLGRVAGVMSGLADLPPASPPRGRHTRTDSNVSTDECVASPAS